jgi:dihydroorotate dehydrogenase
MTYGVLRRFAFRMDPERAHNLALQAARLAGTAGGLLGSVREAGPVEAFGLRFRNPVGLAAGYDKDAVAWRGLAALGIGHIEIGTVTPRPQTGNPVPRITRIPEHGALVNRMGFPSAGAASVAARLTGRRPPGLVLGVSIGPNADTPAEHRADDYVELLDRFAPLADYLAVNVSSPNTPGLRSLESAFELGELLDVFMPGRDEWSARLDRAVPVLVKLSPDLGDLEPVVRTVEDAGCDGIIMGNTTITRPDGIGAALAGGLSGAPLGPPARSGLHQVLGLTRLPVVASGGIMDPDDAVARLASGAVLVQLYSGLVYEGPGLVRRILDAVK